MSLAESVAVIMSSNEFDDEDYCQWSVQIPADIAAELEKGRRILRCLDIDCINRARCERVYHPGTGITLAYLATTLEV